MATKKSNPKRKTSEAEAAALERLRSELFHLIILQVHVVRLRTDKKYFSAYAKQIGIAEKKLKQIMDMKYNGTLPDILVIARRNGVLVEIGLKDNKKKKQ